MDWLAQAYKCMAKILEFNLIYLVLILKSLISDTSLLNLSCAQRSYARFNFRIICLLNFVFPFFKFHLIFSKLFSNH